MANEERGIGMETRNKTIEYRRTASKKPTFFTDQRGLYILLIYLNVVQGANKED